MREIVILGAGFAALTAVREIRKQKIKARIKLIAPRAVFEYLPSAIWIPYGLRKREDLSLSLDRFFIKHDVEYIKASVTGVNSSENKVVTDNAEIKYDFLIIATAGRFIRKIPGIDQHTIIPCAGLDAAEEFKQRLKQLKSGSIAFGFSGNPKEPSAMRGGPVFEFLFGMDTYLKKQGMRDKFELVFFSPAPEPGKRMGQQAVKQLLKKMQKLDIKTYLGSKIVEFTQDSVVSESTSFNSDLSLFIPGLTGPAWLDNTSFKKSPGGFIEADATTLALGTDNVYVAGDAGSFPGPDWQPKQAHMADLQAACAVRNIRQQIDGLSDRYTFKIELACIIDSLNSGVLVYRSQKFKFMFKSRFLHLAKKLYEWYYLRQIKS